MSFAIIIPAAGCSSRLGQLKQLVTVESEPLLQRTVRIAADAAQSLSLDADIFVVLGYQADTINAALSPFFSTLRPKPIHCTFNENWPQGIGSSIAHAIASLNHHHDAVLILLGDQWALQESDIKQIIACWQDMPHKLVASRYGNGEFGVPAIFPKSYFTPLMEMTSHGAKRLIHTHKNQTQFIDIENAIYDLDTPKQLQYLRTLQMQGAEFQPNYSEFNHD